jgi:phosphotransferase system enzyme I (PtsP)
MASTRLMLDDQRLRRRTVEQLEDGVPLAEALDEVARDAARAAARSDEPFLLRRASDLEELCQALTMLAMPDSRATLPSKAVVVARQLGIYDVIISARAQPVGIALTATEPDQRSMQLLELMGLPSVADVGGALRWATPGDIALVDADHGFFIVNPSRAEVAAFRRERRARRQEQPSAPGAASAHS